MSTGRNKSSIRSISAGRYQQSRFYSNDIDIDLPAGKDSLPNILPEVDRIIYNSFL